MCVTMENKNKIDVMTLNDFIAYLGKIVAEKPDFGNAPLFLSGDGMIQPADTRAVQLKDLQPLIDPKTKVQKLPARKVVLIQPIPGVYS